VVEHGGQTDGMHGTVAMMPEEQLGVVVLTNSVLFGFPAAIMYRVFDAYLGRPPRDWSAEIKRALGSIRGGGGSPTRAPPVPGTKPSMPLEKYTGTYRNDLYGNAVVSRVDSGLSLNLLGLTVPLQHWQLDTFRAPWTLDLQRAMLPFATFLVDSRGEVWKLEFENGPEFARVRR
jgi:hypothetical protein